MFTHSLTAKRIFLNAFLSVVTLLIVTAQAGAVTRLQDADDRARAFELFESGNFVAAVPLLEKLEAKNPNDIAILARLGFAIYSTSTTEKDAAKQKQMRERARAILLRSKALGDNSNLTQLTLDGLSSEPGTGTLSNTKDAQEAIRAGEEAFVHGEMDKALAAYKKALELDPKLYEAALYAGDVEFKKGASSTDPQYRSDHFDAAGVWFARAIVIDANRETAYRYWGDALDSQGKTNEARDKFVEAIIAEPFDRRGYMGLTQWGQRHKAALGHPRIEPPSSISTQGTQTTVTIDPQTLDSTDGSNQWLMYSLTRVAWSKGEFFKNYPEEKTYRHSLKEEAAALRMVAEFAARDLKSGKVKALEPSLAMLVALNDGGLLEAYILFAHADQGIATDYANYRKENREKLRRYWLEVVIRG